MMTGDDVLAVLDRLRRAGVRAYVGGGWGIDALLHRQTRPHRDLDLAIDGAREAAAVRALEAAGFAIVPECDWRPARALLRDARGREVDLHPVRFDDAGTGTQANLPGLPPFVYPADQLTVGQIGTRIVPCIGAALQRRFHEGYEPTRRDRHDLRMLRGLRDGGAEDVAPERQAANRPTTREAEGEDGMIDRDRAADALDLWRAGEKNVTRRTLSSDWRDDYEDAVQAAVAYLQRFSRMAELVSSYFDLDEDAWLDALCRRPSGRILNFGDVEDAAYWRRARQLITAADEHRSEGID